MHHLQLPFQHAILALLLAPNATLLAFQPRQIADSAPNAEIPTATDAAIPAFLTATVDWAAECWADPFSTALVSPAT